MTCHDMAQNPSHTNGFVVLCLHVNNFIKNYKKFINTFVRYLFRELVEFLSMEYCMISVVVLTEALTR